MSCLTKFGRIFGGIPAAGLAVSAFLAASPVLGQQRGTPVRIIEISSDVHATPRYDVQISNKQDLGRGRADEWFVARVQYETRSEWLDELTVAFYLLVWDDAQDRDGRGGRLVLQGKTTYVDVAEGEHKAVMALHPNSFKRYGQPEAIAVVITAEGGVAATESQPPARSAWWDQLPSKGGRVINRLSTPWAMLYSDEFEAIKGSTESR